MIFEYQGEELAVEQVFKKLGFVGFFVHRIGVRKDALILLDGEPIRIINGGYDGAAIADVIAFGRAMVIPKRCCGWSLYCLDERHIRKALSCLSEGTEHEQKIQGILDGTIEVIMESRIQFRTVGEDEYRTEGE